MSRTIPALQLVNGMTMPVLGLGTWHMGERYRERSREIEELELGLELGDMEELLALPGGQHCAANQVLYNLNRRGIEWDLLPLCLAHGIAVMAYSPIGQGKLLHSRKLLSVAQRIGVTTAQLALAWL